MHDRRAGRRLKKVEIPKPTPEFGFPANSSHLQHGPARQHALHRRQLCLPVSARLRTTATILSNDNKQVTKGDSFRGVQPGRHHLHGAPRRHGQCLPTRTPPHLHALRFAERGQITFALAYRLRVWPRAPATTPSTSRLPQARNRSGPDIRFLLTYL